MISRRLIRIKVAQELYSHIKSDEKSVERTKKEFLASAQKCYELYLLLLQLIVDVEVYAEKRIEIGKNKLRPTQNELNPNRRFVENPVINLIKDSVQLEKAIGKISWGDHDMIVKELYNKMCQSDFYVSYMEKESVTFADHKKIVTNFYKNFIEENELIEAHVEELSIFWVDNIEYALGFVLQTINDIKQSMEELSISPTFQTPDDKVYALQLLEKSILSKDKYMAVIDQITKNWDLERIAFMDRILMVEAITEMVEFESIPVKATLDEFIEIAKYYSTSQSATFINGVLDKAAVVLKDEIVKSGRGLL